MTAFRFEAEAMPAAAVADAALAVRGAATPSAPVVVPPEGGRAVRAFGNEILFKLTGAETAGALTLGLADAPAGVDGPPLHVHEREDEIFLIVEGTYRVCVAGEWSEAGPGSVVYLPRGVAHTFRVVGDRPGKHWVITTSGDFGDFYARSAEVFAVPGPPDVARLGVIAAEHGMRFERPAGAGSSSTRPPTTPGFNSSRPRGPVSTPPGP